MSADLSALLAQISQSKITELMYGQLAGVQRESRGMPDSTRRAFDSRMRSDAGLAMQGSQNIKDAVSMVSTAQTGMTAIKQMLKDMQKLATEAAASSDQLSPEYYESVQKQLQTYADNIVKQVNSTSFNGFQLLNGSAGMNNDGIIQLQAGNSALNQVFVNMVDGTVNTDVVDGAGKINMNNLKGFMNISSSADAKDALSLVENVLDRVTSVEAQYTYDIKSLNNLSTLLEAQADILLAAQEKHDENPEQKPESYLLDLLNGSGGGILSAKS